MERWDVVMLAEHSSGDMRRSIMEEICPANVVSLGKPMVGHHLHIPEEGHSIASELFPIRKRTANDHQHHLIHF